MSLPSAWMFHEGGFDFEGGDAVARAFDDVVVAADEPDVSVRIAPCHVACIVVAVLPRFLHGVWCAVVFAEEADGTLRLCVFDDDVAWHAVFAWIAIVVQQLQVKKMSSLA